MDGPGRGKGQEHAEKISCGEIEIVRIQLLLIGAHQLVRVSIEQTLKPLAEDRWRATPIDCVLALLFELAADFYSLSTFPTTAVTDFGSKLAGTFPCSTRPAAFAFDITFAFAFVLA